MQCCPQRRHGDSDTLLRSVITRLRQAILWVKLFHQGIVVCTGVAHVLRWWWHRGLERLRLCLWLCRWLAPNFFEGFLNGSLNFFDVPYHHGTKGHGSALLGL